MHVISSLLRMQHAQWAITTMVTILARDAPSHVMHNHHSHAVAAAVAQDITVLLYSDICHVIRPRQDPFVPTTPLSSQQGCIPGHTLWN